MRFVDANVDFEVAGAVVVSAVARILTDFMQRKVKFYTFAIMVSAFSLMQTKSAMLIRMQAPRARGPDGRFLPAASAAPAVAPPAPPAPLPSPPAFAPPTGKTQRRKEEARARLMYIRPMVP